MMYVDVCVATIPVPFFQTHLGLATRSQFEQSQLGNTISSKTVGGLPSLPDDPDVAFFFLD